MSFHHFVVAPLFVAFAMISAGCSSPVPTKVDGAYTLTFHENGGIAGLDDDFIVDSEAKTISHTSRGQAAASGALTDAEIAKVAAAIEAADLANPDDYGGASGISDGLGYALTLDMGGASFKSTWSDGGSPPDAVDAVRILVSQLADAHIVQPD